MLTCEELELKFCSNSGQNHLILNSEKMLLSVFQKSLLRS